MDRVPVTGAEQGVTASSIGRVSVSENGTGEPSNLEEEGDMGPLVAGDAASTSGTERAGENPAVPSSDAETGGSGEVCKAVVDATRLEQRKGDEEQQAEDYTKVLVDYLEIIASESASDHSHTVYGGGPPGLSTTLGAGRSCPPRTKNTAEEGFVRKPSQQEQEEHQRNHPSVPQETSMLARNPAERPEVQTLRPNGLPWFLTRGPPPQ